MKMKINKKKFKYGGYAIIMSVIVVGAIILLNVLTGVVDNKFALSVDMTASRMFSLTAETKNLLTELQKDIYVYTISSSSRIRRFERRAAP